jgi:hypothetical protein
MNGIPRRVMGNGEGFTTLILTGMEALRMREFLTWHAQNIDPVGSESSRAGACLDYFNAGIQRATDRIKAEFDDEQRRRKDAKK